MQHEKNNVRYWTYGNPKKETLLLVHGFTGSHDGFQYIVPFLIDYFIIIPDLPGFGISPLDFDEWTVEALAARINEFVTTLKLKKPPVLISHSLGGLIAASMLDQDSKLYAKKILFISPVATKISWLDSRKFGALAGTAQYAVGAKTGAFGQRFVRNKLLSRIGTITIMTEKKPARRTQYFNTTLIISTIFQVSASITSFIKTLFGEGLLIMRQV